MAPTTSGDRHGPAVEHRQTRTCLLRRWLLLLKKRRGREGSHFATPGQRLHHSTDRFAGRNRVSCNFIIEPSPSPSPGLAPPPRFKLIANCIGVGISINHFVFLHRPALPCSCPVVSSLPPPHCVFFSLALTTLPRQLSSHFCASPFPSRHLSQPLTCLSPLSPQSSCLTSRVSHYQATLSPPIPHQPTMKLSRSSSPELDPSAFGVDFAPLPEYKPAGDTALDFGGLLATPLKVHEDLASGCGGQTWPAGVVLARHMLRYHRDKLRDARM